MPSGYGNLKFKDWIEKPESIKEDKFKFLNVEKQFTGLIPDWNFNGYGKLWNYNLNYMDFLLQPGMRKDYGIKLIGNFIENLDSKSQALEPYPTSLRGINWIKFLSINQIQNKTIDISLFKQYQLLLKNPEYHLLGNHLLENGFSLLFGAFYFNSQSFYNKSCEIITAELSEQILNDGAHFELSPMYHQIILDRLLDCINLVHSNDRFSSQDDLLILMKSKSSLMLSWLNIATFSNGDIPLFNDSAKKIAPSTKELNTYASELGLVPDQIINCLKDSGLVRLAGAEYECITDIGQIGPSYQPGHAHADTFTFGLNLNGKPLIVDTGVSTYEKNERRQIERSTAAHNTVQVENKNSSEVWGGFRVAHRAKVVFAEETEKGIKARHNGYENLGIIHEREFTSEPGSLSVNDQLIGDNQLKAISRFHFHPNIDITSDKNYILFEGGTLFFENMDSILIKDYLHAPEFNVLIPGKVVEVTFTKYLRSAFHFS